MIVRRMAATTSLPSSSYLDEALRAEEAALSGKTGKPCLTWEDIERVGMWIEIRL